MTTWQLRCPMAPRRWIEVIGSVGGLIPVDVNLAQTSSEIQLTSLPVSNNAMAECCAMWMSISGTTLCLLTRLPATGDLINEQCSRSNIKFSFDFVRRRRTVPFSPERTCWFLSLLGPLRCWDPRSVLRILGAP
jgi:hypothetical protein